jgi:hypothetical protein
MLIVGVFAPSVLPCFEKDQITGQVTSLSGAVAAVVVCSLFHAGRINSCSFHYVRAASLQILEELQPRQHVAGVTTSHSGHQ